MPSQVDAVGGDSGKELFRRYVSVWESADLDGLIEEWMAWKVQPARSG